jgi:uncharacterized protein (TIGR02147 family)
MEYIRQLEEHFQTRKKQNPVYSLRAYARDLGLHPSTLLKVMSGKRGLPFADVESVASRLNLSFQEREEFLGSVLQSRGMQSTTAKNWSTPIAKELKNDVHFQILADWEYFAFLNLLSIQDFKSDLKWASQRLGISLARAEKVFENLMKAEMIEIDKSGQWKRRHPRLTSTDDLNALALKVGHQNEMRLATAKMWDTPVEERDFCSMMMAVNPKHIKKAKKITRAYIRQMEKLLETGEQSEVYQLSVQLYPITTKLKKNIRKTT